MKQLILSGGLGNQMFEYAFYLSCKKKGMNIKLNRDMYEVNRMHNGYMLNRTFGIPEEELVGSNSFTVFITRVLRRYNPFNIVYDENPRQYSDLVYSTPQKYINGVFIGERYFADVIADVRNTFVFRNIDSHNNYLASRMQQCESVSVHIRRGDYLNNPSWCVCKDVYYKNAIMYIKNKVKTPVFFVFSDDPEWCEGFMKKFGVNFEILSHNTGCDSYKDMFLMSKCRYNIIANSTFSWWGAWLNEYDNKIVCRPSVWLKDREVNPYLKDWIKINVE